MEIIKARVMNRIGSEAEWLQYDPVILEGEICLVIFSPTVVRSKVGVEGGLKFSELEYNVIDPNPVENATLSTIPVDGDGVLIYNVTDDGYYPGFSITVTAEELASGFVQFANKNSIWTKQIKPIPGIGAFLGSKGIYPDLYPDEDIISDPEGYYIFRANKTEVNYIDKVSKTDFLSISEKVSKYDQVLILDMYPGEYLIADPEGYIATWIKADGSFNYVGKDSGGDIPTVNNGATYGVRVPTDYMHIIDYGQSLSVAGSATDNWALYGARTFAGGILTGYDPDVAGAANTYFGSGLVDLSTSGTETQLRGIVRVAKEQIAKFSGKKPEELGFNFIVNAPGSGGLSWGLLSDVNGVYYRRLIESVRRAKDFAFAEGKTYSVYGYAYIQGENTADKSVSSATWYTRLETLYQQLNTDIKAITGQTYDIQCLNYQIASYPNNEPATVNPPLGTLNWCLEKDYAHFGCSMYQMDYADSLHGTSLTYRMMGAMMGVVLARLFVRDFYRAKNLELPIISNTKPIYPISKKVTVNAANTIWILEIFFQVTERQRLVIDETVNPKYVTPPVNYGFSIKNGSTEIIQSVYVGDDRIAFKCNANPTGLILEYAVGGRASGGNIRDNQGEYTTFTQAGVSRRIDNWMPIFKYTI